MKILYLIHVCWEWIFQRPQILALLLQEDFECTVVSKKFICSRKLTRNNTFPDKMLVAYQLPGAEKISVIKNINGMLYKEFIKKCKEYDAVWVCHPELFQYIPEDYTGNIIYDCMDNHVAMASGRDKQKLYALEQRLIERANTVFVSSQKLREVVPNLDDSILIRNGFRSMEPATIKKGCLRPKYKIGYFGTISSWFDFELLIESYKRNNVVEYHMLGPVEKGMESRAMQDTFGIRYEGIVEHAQLGDYIADYDALIMPFVVNDIILSVDPVKLYEYICFGKCILSVWYPEIDRFNPYVYFYRNAEEYFELVDRLAREGFPPKYNEAQQKEFLAHNTWEWRYKTIRNELQKL